MHDEKKKDFQKKYAGNNIQSAGSIKAPARKTHNDKNFIERAKEYNRILSIDSIARRYVVMNGFDGVLPILGILISGFVAGVADARLVIGVCLGAAVAMAISGVWGAYMAESAERRNELKYLESKMLTPLDKTKIGRAGDFASLIIAFINGAAPFIAAVIVILPFFFLPISLAYYTSFVISFIILFILGIFLGGVAKSNLIISGIKMVFAGIVIITIILLLGAPVV